jgi:hypothetical protein
VDSGEQGFARLLGEVEHDVTQEDDVEAVAGAVEGQLGRAEVGLAEVAEIADFGLDGPVFANLVEVADYETGGKATIDFDAMEAASVGTLDDLVAEIGAFNADVPADEHGKMRAH